MKEEFEFFEKLKERARIVINNSNLGQKADLIVVMQMLMQKDFLDALEKESSVVNKPKTTTTKK